MTKEKVAIGVDLGSTQSELAVFEHGKPVVIFNEEGSNMTPSVVSLKNGERKVGAAAKRQMVANPKETVNIIKRFMGCTYDETEEARKHVQYDVVNVNGQPRVKIENREYSPEEISSMIIHSLKKSAENYLGKDVTHAVITVPAFFSNAAREATKKAGELAGLEVMRIINEPTAAILSSNIDMEKGGKYMVADYGGSTLDFSIADIENKVVEILATNGDVFNGGHDLDIALTNWLVEEFKNETGVDLSNDVQAMARIVADAEKAKIDLSSSSQTEVNIPYITMGSDNKPIHLVKTVTRAKFEQLITPIVDKIIKCAKNAMEAAGQPKLDGILLVGGSCRIPMIQERLEKEFGVPLIKSSNMDLAVAEGAAIQANILAGGDSDMILLDCVPMNYSIETEGGVATTIIEANTTIPCKRSQIFSTAVDNQPAVTINVLNGLRPMAKDNKLVGTFNLDGIPAAKRGIPMIEVTFDVDANGILTVTAVDKGTGKEQHITIENKSGLTDEEVERIKKDAEEHEAEDKKEKERIEKVNKCESMIYTTERQLDEYKDKEELTQEDKDFFNAKIEEFKKMKEDNDYAKLDELSEEVQKKWWEISTKIYAKANPQGENGQHFSAEQFQDMFKNAQQQNGTQTADASPVDESSVDNQVY